MEDSLDKQLTRAWSAVVARGDEDTSENVAEQLAKDGPRLTAHDVAMRLAHLRRIGVLP